MWNHIQNSFADNSSIALNSDGRIFDAPQNLAKSLDLTAYLKYVDQVFSQPSSESEDSDNEFQLGNNPMMTSVAARLNNDVNLVQLSKSSDTSSNCSLNLSVSSPSSSTSGLSSSSSDSEFGATAFDPLKLAPISDDELENLLKIHKVWKKSPYPLGTQADIKSLLNASSRARKHRALDGKSGCKPFKSSHPEHVNDNLMISGLNCKGRSRKQSLKNVRNEVTVSASANAPSTSTANSVPITADIPFVEIKEEPLITIKKEPDFDTVAVESPSLLTSMKPTPILASLSNFMDEVGEAGAGEDDNDSLSDYMSMAAAASSASAQLLTSTTIKTSFNEVPAPVSSGDVDVKPLVGPETIPVTVAVTSAVISEPNVKKKKESSKVKKVTSQKQAKMIEVLNMKRRRIYVLLCKKEIGRTQRARASNHKENLAMKRRLALACSRNLRQQAIQSQKAMKESVWRAKRLAREMVSYWKQADRVEREVRKRREKEAEEQRKLDMELMEAKRQQRKLNFLITQTELYAHFMSKKLGSSADENESNILHRLNEEKNLRLASFDDYDSQVMMARAKQNVENAFRTQQCQVTLFDQDVSMRESFKKDLKLETTEGEYSQPKMFEGVLKHYQLKGMNWLVNLYDQGINGILADEMGLGKTVQSMAFFAHVAERYGVWGPFLVIAPASTLHNWQQEFKRFVPRFKVVPYWGNPQERRILRQFWQQTNLHTEKASFHVVITSYQIVITDFKFFKNRVKWQYLILDEAQAIKSTASARWKMLLSFSCRNRLLLTGTPIQNTMAELWALLHFIMPSLFDSHEEFSEWFSKDIESHAENKSSIDERHLSRLHLILKPFMLRRLKKDVENELSDKVEVLVNCPLTARQKMFYSLLKKKSRIEDLLKTAGPSNAQLDPNSTTNLMKLVMQFRKVCNHPDLFERLDVQCPHRLPVAENEYPNLIFREGMLSMCVNPKSFVLENQFSIFHEDNIHQSLKTHVQITSNGFTDTPRVCRSEWSFSRFIDLSPTEINRIIYGGIIEKWKYILRLNNKVECLYFQRSWSAESNAEAINFSYPSSSQSTNVLHGADFLLWLDVPTNFPNVMQSAVLQDLIFTNYTSTLYTLKDHTIYSIPQTVEYRRCTNTKHVKAKSFADEPEIKSSKLWRNSLYSSFSEVRFLQRTYLPSFLYSIPQKVVGMGRELHFNDKRAAEKLLELLYTSSEGYNLLMHGSASWRKESTHFVPVELQGLDAIQPFHGWSLMVVPDKEKLVSDSGKLGVLDCLLRQLKSNGHRVLIYSQMTKMIDILEEYMWYRKWTYIRLDGSSKIAERRDMVADFQTRSDIFVFLLSTRAGGLGINLTAADTVIFYDSDWNPTVDQQAMDRAHRLGQTKQVHVYRLICKGTIEERILQRAREKNEIQKIVISGGNLRQDALKPKEVVSLLLDDEEMERKYRQKLAERRNVESRTSDPSTETKPSTSGTILGKRKLKNIVERLTGEFVSSSVSSSTVGSVESSGPSSPLDGSHDMPALEADVIAESLEARLEEDKSTRSNSLPEERDVVSPSTADGYKTLDWGNDSYSDYESDFPVLPKRTKQVRGNGKRGRPPSRVRVPFRESERLSDSSNKRGPGRPRLRPVGPANTGNRGRRPGRPPLSRKSSESLSSALTPLTTSQRVFGFYSSLDLDIS